MAEQIDPLSFFLDESSLTSAPVTGAIEHVNDEEDHPLTGTAIMAASQLLSAELGETWDETENRRHTPIIYQHDADKDCPDCGNMHAIQLLVFYARTLEEAQIMKDAITEATAKIQAARSPESGNLN